MLPILEILPGCHKRFLAGYPWLYNNEISRSHSTKNLEPGQLVHVAYQGKGVATGYFNRHSLISFRALSRMAEEKEKLDTPFFMQRLHQALDIRSRFFNAPYYRLIHAEADGLPGLIVDRFDDVFVLQINTQGMEKLKAPLLQALETLFHPTSLYLKNDSPIRSLEGLPLTPPEIIGKPLTHLRVIENDTVFAINMHSSQKTGWFFDHRDNRHLIANLAANKTMIDYFCYSGGFSLQALKQGAKRVIGVDSSETALQNARASLILNKIPDNCCEFICRDVFKDMDERAKAQESFDIVILDPPAFVKAKKDLITGLKGYEKLITKALPLVAKKGLLLIASCSYHVKENDLQTTLGRALYKNQREGKIVKMLSAGPDHPLHPLLEESRYLKGFLVALH